MDESKLEAKLVRPGDAKAQEPGPRLAVFSANWRSVLEDMAAASEACRVRAVALGVESVHEWMVHVANSRSRCWTRLLAGVCGLNQLGCLHMPLAEPAQIVAGMLGQASPLALAR